jgi:hypothetical protein
VCSSTSTLRKLRNGELVGDEHVRKKCQMKGMITAEDVSRNISRDVLMSGMNAQKNEQWSPMESVSGDCDQSHLRNICW